MSNKDGWIYGGSQVNGFFGAGPNSPETGDYASTHQKVQQVKYTAPATNKLLLEAGFGTYISQWGYTERPGNPTKNLVRVQEQSAQIFDRNGNRVPTSCDGCLTVGGNLKYRSSNWPTGYIFAHTWNAAASFVTGAHNMKFGYQGAFHRDDDNLFPTISNDFLMQCTFNTPCSAGAVSDHADTPTGVHDPVGRVHAEGAHRSTTRSTRRSSGRRIGLTLQGALRFDHAWSSFPEQQIGPSVTIPNAIVLPAQVGIKGYNDLSPRIGVAYDLFGNGKTSVKGNVGRYLHPASNQGRYINANPSELVSTITAGPWTDNNGNFQSRLRSPERPAAETGDHRVDRQLRRVAGSELRPRQARNEARRLDSRRLGRASVRLAVRRVGSAGTDAASVGRGRLLPPVVADLHDRRRHRQHLRAAADYTQFSVVRAERSATAGRRRLLGAEPLQHHRVGAALAVPRTCRAAANDFGAYARYWDGFDVTAQARLRNGLTLQGGTSTGRLVFDQCEPREAVPEGLGGGVTNPYCRQVEPMMTTFKGVASYIIPRVDVNVSGTFSSRPGVSLTANVVYTQRRYAQSCEIDARPRAR